MRIIDWLKHCFTISRYASDRAVYFARAAHDQGLPLDYGNERRLAELLANDDDLADNLNEVAKLLGQPIESPKP